MADTEKRLKEGLNSGMVAFATRANFAQFLLDSVLNYA
jgi:hypothetical protein